MKLFTFTALNYRGKVSHVNMPVSRINFLVGSLCLLFYRVALKLEFVSGVRQAAWVSNIYPVIGQTSFEKNSCWLFFE